MTGRELVEALLDYDLDLEIMLASDSEGNEYAPLVDLAPGVDEENYEEPVIVLWP